jgi:hypothetical protein
MNDEESIRLAHLRNDNQQLSPAIRDIYAAECTRCGVCCVYYSQRPFGVPVFSDDVQTPRKLIQIGPRYADTTRYMRMEPMDTRMFFGWKGFSKCIAFKGNVGDNAA